MKRTRASFLAMITIVAGATRADADTLELRVVTYNAWDLAFVSTDRDERIARIGPAIAELKPDLVSFQELWVNADAEKVASELAKIGLVHTRRFPSGFVGSGLLIASRFPIRESSFVRYTLGGKPQKPWHGDWYGGKGIGRVVVETALGPLEVADTHLHASYDESGEYDLFQVAESLEAVDFLGSEGEHPLVLGGDLNVNASELPFRLLTSRCGLDRIEREPGIDWVLFRSGKRVSVRAREVRKVLAEPVDVGGRRVRLSDHDGVLVVLELSHEEKPRPPGERDTASETQALELLDAGRTASTRWTIVWCVLGLLGVAAGVGFARVARRRSEKRRRVWALAGVLLGAGALALALGFAYEPYERRGLADARARLERH